MKRLITATGLLVLALVSCKSDSSGPGVTISCTALDPVCPTGATTGFTGPAGAPTITPTSSSTNLSVSASAFTVSGATNGTTTGYWFLVVGNTLRAWGQLSVSGGAYNDDIPLFCGAQLVLVSFNNASGRSYWGTTVTLTGCTTPAFRTQLTWDTGPSSGAGSSDIDLHLVRPAGSVETANDCYYANCQGFPLEWGVVGAAGNPLLDVDNTTGFGPENITIGSGAETGQYTIVVRNYNGVANTHATVKIYFNDVEIQRYTSAVLTPGTADYWQVAKVNILTSTITAVNTYSTAPPFAMGDLKR